MSDFSSESEEIVWTVIHHCAEFAIFSAHFIGWIGPIEELGFAELAGIELSHVRQKLGTKPDCCSWCTYLSLWKIQSAPTGCINMHLKHGNGWPPIDTSLEPIGLAIRNVEHQTCVIGYTMSPFDVGCEHDEWSWGKHSLELAKNLWLGVWSSSGDVGKV